MSGTGSENRQSVPAASGWPTGTVTAYAAAILAFGYALVSLYRALGGHALVSTVGLSGCWGARNRTTLHWSPQIPGSSDFLPKSLPKRQHSGAETPYLLVTGAS
jgi:hypothetical protein